MHKKLLLYFLFFCLPLAVQGQSIEVPDLSGLPQPTQAKALRYWFDDDTEVKVVNQLSGQQTLDVSELLDGLHTLNYQIVDDKDIAAYISTSIFIKMSNSSDASTPQSVSYWFDDNSTDRKYISSSGIQMLDVSNLTEGLHTLNYQVICSDGTPACIYTSIFMKTKGSWEEGNVKASRLLYWFDDNTEIKHADMAQSIQLLDASELHDGLHTLHYQVQCENGDVTPVMSAIFMRLSIDVTATSAKSLRYWFDDDASTVNVISVANGTQTLNVADLPIGMHTLNYQLIDSNGNVTPTVTRMFLKQFDKVLANSHNGITKYEYWLNEHSTAMQSIMLADAPNPYTLIALLPMQKEPLNTLNFHYEANNGNPMIYAKNEFHIRFHDAAGYWVDESKPFIDYSIYKEVNPVGEISATQTFPKVAQNDIRWYTMQSEIGDTIALKLSQPATIRVFAPSGEEVFKTSAAESVKWDGIHTWEEGTYYIAVHDVTGSQSTMKLEYIHIEKYAVLSHSLDEIGVMEGNFYVNLFGNGYDKLTKAHLVNGSNTLIADIIQVQDICNATLQFSFPYNYSPRGKFDLVLEFIDNNKKESIKVVDAVNITDPIFGDITVDIIDSRVITRPHEVIIKVKNTGNITYQFVPLYFANSIDEGLESVQMLNFGILSNKKIIDAGIKNFYKIDNFLGEDSCIVIPTIIPVLNPNQEMEFKLGFVSKLNSRYNMYAWTETPWNMRNIDIPKKKQGKVRKNQTTNITCEIDPCELVNGIPNSDCVCSMLWGNVSTIANTVGATYQWRNNQLHKEYGQWYEDNGIEWPYRKIPLKSPADIINDVAADCLGELLPEGLKKVQDNMKTALDIMRDLNESNCPSPKPCPVHIYTPVDPNDIYGYTSNTGSKFLAKDIVNVYYDIEFENDSTLSNAAAHHIMVRDTLDVNCFDLSTFTPTSIKLGNKEIILNGEKNFIKTIDLRPDINVIAQIQLQYNEQKGIATWDFLALDPITLDPTYDILQGILPVNYDGKSGIGEVAYDINLYAGLADGTEINNRASIVFDFEKPIITPTWTNIVDAVAPTSTISDLSILNDTTIHITADAYDARSGVWKYEWYVQCGEDAPWWKEGETDTLCFDYRIYEDIDYGFCVLATDSAGNVEQKVLLRESRFKIDEYGNVETYIETPKDSGGNTPPVIYDLSGRRLTKPQENRINIIGRKKVLYRKYKQ